MTRARATRAAATVVRFSPKRPSLGDKMQRLAGLSRGHMLAVELLVDRILERLDRHTGGAK
jgi:hypothetical protein